MRLRLLFVLSLTCLIGPRLAAESPEAQQAMRIEFFERKVRPIFEQHCSSCHAADTKPSGGLRVDDVNGLLTGGNSGAAVVPGKPGESLLLKRVSKDAKKRMPAESDPLSDEQIATLAKWIEDGAAWPALEVKVPRNLAKYEQMRKEHWAWQPLTTPRTPDVKNGDWPRSEIDRFVLARLEAEQLSPVADADKATLLRRVTYDLTGLPPTPAELDEFLQDTRETAWEYVVDRLLKSPAFGEQWGRHWLDVARYGESTGPSRNIPYPHAWRYRDYVIDAVNQDLPFDEFLREQVAGDLLPARDDAERNRRLIATGFLALGVKDVNQRFPVRFQMDNVDEQIDVVTRAVLALTVSCSRCHDHKFDPVPQHDYYALAGIFTSTEMFAGLRSQMGGSGLAYYVPNRLVRLSGDVAPADPAEAARLTAEVQEAKEKWEAVRGTPEGLKPGADGKPFQKTLRDKYDALQNRLNALTDPAQRGFVAHGVRDAEKIANTALRVRGEAEKLGPVVPRGFLSTFDVPGAAPVNAGQSGRIELANWLASDANPLTPRVFVNRVWSHLFDRGLVSTVDNFGVTGDSPSHPELLDYLAKTAIADGWSLKRLVRRIVLTRTYQLSSAATPEHRQRDPSNRWLWRHAPRRLTAEELRDSLLLAAGSLDRSRPDGSPAQKFKMVEMADNGSEAKSLHEQANAAKFRSLYLPQLRGVTPKSLEAFDPVGQTLVSGSREVTTVPSQALFLLNSAFVRQQAMEFARRLLAEDGADGERIQRAYRLTLVRAASPQEVARAAAFLDDYAATYRDDAVLARNEPAPANGKAAVKAMPANPDAVDQTGVAVREETVRPDNARTAAWMALGQALFVGAEFRYVR